SQTNQPLQEDVAEPSHTNQPLQEDVAEPSHTNQPVQEEVAEENINAPTPDDLVADTMETDDDYDSSSLNEEQEDDERTIDEDEAQITEAERNEELAALQAEADIPIDDLLKSYLKSQGKAVQLTKTLAATQI
uniref:Uncharacterized protein n=1 Tax=Aegilops tauschii subsp. strangulata TaxID=200361 RepID=A0A453TAG0_AEGTS